MPGPLPADVALIRRVHPKGALYAPPPRPPGQRGPRRQKGVRLPGAAAWAADRSQHWEVLNFDPFGLHATVAVKARKALSYQAGKDRLLTLVWVQDLQGQRPRQLFSGTRLDWDARQLLSCYAGRRAIAVTVANSKPLWGLQDPATRTPVAVPRTAPWALVVYSLIVAWFQRDGHRQVRYPERPWYRHKAEPSFADLVTGLRRQTWAEPLAGVLPQGAPRDKSLEALLEAARRSGSRHAGSPPKPAERRLAPPFTPKNQGENAQLTRPISAKPELSLSLVIPARLAPVKKTGRPVTSGRGLR